ncbi:unannotated protein [freshwater metagenome]|uniref:Unannotated protein n=1 Tax=freshwater metagenome TaxID=449393 RepID=A0A6J6Y1E2_9ZZZZ
MTGGVDQVNAVVSIVEANTLELDRDTPFTFNVHRVEILRTHLAGVDSATQLEQAVREGGLAVIDVGDDAEVADTVEGGHEGSCP